jgi:hypothetical protein
LAVEEKEFLQILGMVLAAAVADILAAAGALMI